jgi:heme exporter protein A
MILSTVAIDRVQVQRLSKRYGNHRALAGVSIELQAGSACALLGPNGAGKSTFLGIVSTLVRATSGSVDYLAAETTLPVDDALRREIGLLSHASLCYGELSAVENLRFFAGLYGVAEVGVTVDRLLDQVGLEAQARHRPARLYSRGMLQRLSLARALLADPSLVLLDEPFTGLDRSGADALAVRIAEVKARGAVVVVVTHDLEAMAQLADHVVLLRHGAVVCDQRQAGGYSYADLAAVYREHTQGRS